MSRFTACVALAASAALGAVTNYIRSELARRFGSFKFVVYDTSDPSLTNGRKLTVVGQLELELGV